MKAKKLLSFMLAIVMVVSMIATLGIQASAEESNTCAFDSIDKKMTVQINVPTKLTIGSTPEPIALTVDSSFCECTASYMKRDIAYYEGYDTELYMAYDNFLWSIEEGTVVADTTYAYCISGEMKNSTDFANVEATVNGQPVELIAVDDYYFYFFVTIGTTDTNGNIVANTVLANAFLDLDNTTANINDNKELDQNYNLTVSVGDQAAVTKVKLSWEISDINAARTDNMVWDTTELKWVVASSNTTVTDKGTARFTLENYSSVQVDAQVTFDTTEYEEGKKFATPTLVFDEDNDKNTKDDGEITLDTANGNDTYSKENVPTGIIDVTVTPDADDFETLAATTTATKYGIYTVTISQVKEKVTLTFTRTSSSTSLSYDGKNYDMGESFSFKVSKNSVVSIVNTGVVGVGPTQSTLTVDGKTVTQYSETGSITSWTNISDGAVVTEDMTINTFSCILSGNKVTLADGSTKLIDDVTTEDKLMTFNFYKGKLDGNYPMYVMKHENVVADVITITLDNGTILEMCDWQQFFDMDRKTYFDIDAVNYKEAVGRDILFVDNGMVTTAKVVNATMETRICTSYEIFTEYNKNFVANGILTVEPETYLQGVYTIGDDLKIDMEQYQKDVDTYGRYSYEEFADMMTRDEFEKMNIADKKIAVGKGIVSEGWLFALYKMWTPIYH